MLKSNVDEYLATAGVQSATGLASHGLSALALEGSIRYKMQCIQF